MVSPWFPFGFSMILPLILCLVFPMPYTQNKTSRRSGKNDDNEGAKAYAIAIIVKKTGENMP